MASARVSWPALLFLLVPSAALAQGQPAPTSAGDAPAQPAGAASGNAGAAADGASSEPAKPKVDATGYGYSDAKPARTAHRRVVHRSGPVATLPGFEMLADGGSRLFVQLSQNVPVEEKRGSGTVTYVLKGAHVEKYNNERPLVTVHFNTPVARARLVPSGKDLLFVVDLRASAQPTWKIDAAKDGGAILAIDFAKGDYAPSAPNAPTADEGNDDGTQDAPKPKPAAPPPARRAPKKR